MASSMLEALTLDILVAEFTQHQTSNTLQNMQQAFSNPIRQENLHVALMVAFLLFGVALQLVLRILSRRKMWTAQSLMVTQNSSVPNCSEVSIVMLLLSVKQVVFG